MKKLTAIAATVAIIAMAGSAMAATTANLAVSADVTASCSIVGGSLPFGNLDAVSAPAVNNVPSAGVTVTCTNGTTYNVTRNDGSNGVGGILNLKETITGTLIPYTLTMPAGTTGTGAAQAVAIAGSIAAGSYAGAAAGAYSDTVVLTVGP